MLKNRTENLAVLVLLSLAVLFTSGQVSAQKFVQDSLVVSLQTADSTRSVPVVIDSIIDNRNVHPRLIGRYEHNRYIFIPLDLLILTDKPLSEHVFESLQFPKPGEQKTRFRIAIDEFSVTKKTNSRLSSGYVLNASLSMYSYAENGRADYLGQLLYESKSGKPIFRDKLKKGFENVLQKWHEEFVNDLQHISIDNSVNHLSLLDNYRRNIYLGKSTNLYGGTDIILTNDGWIFDNEILFSHREARKSFHRSGYSIRYRKADSFTSIEYGLTDDSWIRRINERWILRSKAQMYFGINKWNDIETKEHKIYDALIADVSLSQSIMFNPLDKRSIIIGAGLFENIYYIYSRNFNFHIGLSLHIGIKL